MFLDHPSTIRITVYFSNINNHSFFINSSFHIYRKEKQIFISLFNLFTDDFDFDFIICTDFDDNWPIFIYLTNINSCDYENRKKLTNNKKNLLKPLVCKLKSINIISSRTNQRDTIVTICHKVMKEMNFKKSNISFTIISIHYFDP